MTGAQWAAFGLAVLTVAGYVCRMGAFDPRRDHPGFGLTHYAGFSAAVWVGFSAWAGPPGPEHGAAIVVSIAWLAISYGHHKHDAQPSGWARINPLDR